MIYQALLVPDERPTSLREVKRALLTYDRVVLVDPTDRDLIPANAFMSVVLGLPVMGLNTGPVRPMGKVTAYDEDTQRVLDQCRAGIEQGLVSVQGTYTRQHENAFTIGGVPLGGYPLNPRFVYWLYRSMARDANFLEAACAHSGRDLIGDGAHLGLILSGVGDAAINDLPALPLVHDGTLSDKDSEALTHLARARLAAFIKFTGYCEAKELIPVLPHHTYGRIAERLFNNCRMALQEPEATLQLSRSTRVLQLCHEEYLVDERLDALSISQVIGLRTPAWGKQAAAREQLFRSIRELAQSAATEGDFDHTARALVHNYRIAASAVERERDAGDREPCARSGAAG